MKKELNNTNKSQEFQLSKRDEERAMELEQTVLNNDTARSFKRDLITIEKENHDAVVMLKCSSKGDWFEIAERSVLIYYYYILRPLKLKTRGIEANHDSFYAQYRIGGLRVRGIEGVHNKLRRAGLYENEHAVTGKMFFFFEKEIYRTRI